MSDTSREAKSHPPEKLYGIVSMLANFVWTGQMRPGEHMWSIPADPARDFDCILTDAIDELVALRAEVVRLKAER